jgi:hypothetical protein
VEALRGSLDAMMTRATLDVSELTLEEITAKGRQVRDIEAISSLQHESILSVAAAVFLPLTLISGIYGMNFDVMPELHVA